MNVVRVPGILQQDLVYALRTLKKEPALVITALLTMALTIGGNTALFTVIHSVLLRPLPYTEPERLVRLSGGATPARFSEMRATQRSMTDVGAFTGEETPTISSGGEPEVLKSVRVSANFLQILDVRPEVGRAFRPEDDLAGSAAVVMISDALWRRRFGGDPEIGGKPLTVAGQALSITGVLPPHFAFPYQDVDVWQPAPSEWPLFPEKSRALSPFLTIFGRLKPDATIEQANAEATVIRHQYAMAHPTMLDAKPKKPERVTAWKDELVANVRSTLWMLLGAVGFVLLIACANIASLLLVRTISRSREMAVRAALGASGFRIVAQLVAESLLLTLAGGGLGVLVAAWGLAAIPNMSAFELPRTQEIHMDWMVLGFAAALSILTGVVFGVLPSFSAARPDPIRVLRAGGEVAQQATGKGVFSGVSLRGLLLAGQVALSVVLLIGAALLIESVSRLRRVAVGFEPAHVLTASVSLSPTRYDTEQKRARFFEQLVKRAESSPGIRSASAAMFLPMMGYAGTPVQDAAKPPLKLNERLIATFSVITPGYFETLGIPLRRGRDFSERDQENSGRVAIIDEAMARRFWPEYPEGQSPIGKRIWVGGIHKSPAEIIGIAADVHQTLENSGWPETVYVSFAQNPQPFAMVAVKTNANPTSFIGLLREQVRAVDGDQSIAAARPMEELVDEQVGKRRLLAILLGAFATLALLLVAMGIYGIIAYSVAQRGQELGIRRALGANRGDILWLVVGQSLRPAVVGVALGLGGAFALTRVLASLLFRVSATDPATFVTVAALFLLVALAASVIPATQATKIAPSEALRAW